MAYKMSRDVGKDLREDERKEAMEIMEAGVTGGQERETAVGRERKDGWKRHRVG